MVHNVLISDAENLHTAPQSSRLGAEKRGHGMTHSKSGTVTTSTESADGPYANKVTELVENLGKALVAFTLDADVSTVGRWARGTSAPKNLDVERRIENFYRAYRYLMTEDGRSPERSAHEVRAWLMGVNPHLDDAAPAEAIRDGDYRAVMAAARAYATGG